MNHHPVPVSVPLGEDTDGTWWRCIDCLGRWKEPPVGEKCPAGASNGTKP